MKGFGKHIKTLRSSRRMTLSEVARKTGIDEATLSRIENEKMTGTLDSHVRIAGALGIRLPDLYENVLLNARAQKESIAKKKVETFFHSSGAVAELLTDGVLQKKMLPVLLKIRGGGRTENEEYAPGTERFVYVIKGVLDVLTGKDKKTLRPGEGLYFNAGAPHAFHNPGQTETRCLSVLTPSAP